MMPDLSNVERRKWKGELLRNIERVVSIVVPMVIFSLLMSLLVLTTFILSIAGGKLLFEDVTFSIDPSLSNFIDVIIWPLVVTVALVCAAFSRTSRLVFSNLLERVSSLKAGGYEVSFSSSSAQRIKRNVEITLDDFATQGQLEYDRAARTHNVRSHLESAVKAFVAISKKLEIPNQFGVDLKDIRVTVHMPDVVFEDSLYQLLDYYPKGGGRGRRFSIRYGGIGLAWRIDESRHWNTKASEGRVEALVQSWGMTQEEAGHSQSYAVAICIVLRDDDGQKAGILYLDSKKLSSMSSKEDSDGKGQSKDVESLMKALDAHQSLKPLANSVRKVFKDVARAGTFISIYE